MRLRRNDLQQLLARTADHDGRVRLLHWTRMIVGFLYGEVASVVSRLLLCPHCLNQLDSVMKLIETFSVGGIGISMGVIFRALPARADAKDEPSVTDVVEGRGHLGQHGWRTKGHRRHRRRQTDILGHRGNRAQRGVALQLRRLRRAQG